jgi:adenosine deaminase
MIRIPKVELHLHLDCSLSYAVASRLKPGLTRQEYRHQFTAPSHCSNLVDYIQRAQAGIALMQTREQLKLVTLDLFEQLAADGVIYAEIRFAPLLHTQRELTPREVVEAVSAAADEGTRTTGVEGWVILCTLRHFTEAQSMETVRLVEEFKGSRVAGFDLAADEAGYPITAHVPAFRYAMERGIQRTAHAGEARGPESVWETLREFCPSRIGHGVRSAEDPALVEHLVRERVHLEVCPTSNVQTGTVASLQANPVDKLYRAGVSLSVNCDGRTISETTLEREYRVMQETFGWAEKELLTCNREAMRVAFAPDDVKKRIEEKLVAGFGAAV